MHIQEQSRDQAMLFPERLDDLIDADNLVRVMEDVLNEVAERTEANPMIMQRRKGMVEHPFGTLKRNEWMAAGSFSEAYRR